MDFFEIYEDLKIKYGELPENYDPNSYARLIHGIHEPTKVITSSNSTDFPSNKSKDYSYINMIKD